MHDFYLPCEATEIVTAEDLSSSEMLVQMPLISSKTSLVVSFRQMPSLLAQYHAGGLLATPTRYAV